MAKRYKEEMMKLYQKSGAASRTMEAQSGNGTGSMGAGMSGNPIPSGIPSPSAVARENIMNNRPSQNGGMQNGNMQNGNMQRNMNSGRNRPRPPMQNPNNSQSIPVNCDCRFPSAESIINSLANTPMTLPLTPEDNPEPVAPVPDNTGGSLIQPRTAQNTAVSTPSAPSSDMQNDEDCDVPLRSIILNFTPENPTLAVPTQTEDSSEQMPDFAMPADLSADSDSEVPSTVNFTPSRSWVSMTGDNSWGFLQVQVYTTSNGDFPVQGAMVIVKKQVNAGLGLTRVLFTDENGYTPTIALPAPGAVYPNVNSSSPYSEYELTIVARGYYVMQNISTGVFAGSKTVQPVDLVPLPTYPTYPVYPPQPRSDGSQDVSVG